MNIQGIGSSTAMYRPMAMSGTRGTTSGFDPPPIPDSGKIMDNDDADQNGVLTIEETPLSEAMFSNADSDSDGRLTVEELEEMLSQGPQSPPVGGMGMAPPDAATIMENDDADGDGQLSIDETPLTEEMFNDADTDANGYLSSDELETFIENRPPPMGGPPPPGGMEASDAASILSSETFNEDGSISLEETSLPDQIFSLLDTNQDGVISQEELEQAISDNTTSSTTQDSASTGRTTGFDLAMAAYQKTMSAFMMDFGQTGGASGYTRNLFSDIIV